MAGCDTVETVEAFEGNVCAVKVGNLTISPREGNKVWCHGQEFDMSSWRDIINLCITVDQSAARRGAEDVRQQMRSTLGIRQ